VNPLSEYDKKILHLVWQAQYEEALWLAEEELYLAESTYGHYHLETAKVLNNLGWLNDILGNYEDAEHQYSEALEIKLRTCGIDSVELLPTLENLTGFYLYHQQLTKAKKLLEKMVAIVDSQNKNYRMRKSIYLCQLADIEDELGNAEQAEHLLWESLSFFQTNFGFKHPNAARIFAKIAAFYEKHQNFRRAEFCYNRALYLLKKYLPAKHPDVKFVRDGLYNIYSELGINVRIP